MKINIRTAVEFLPLFHALAEGKAIQRRYINASTNTGDFRWEDTDFIDPAIPADRYRIKPTPTLRPWRPEEVPVGALVRNKQRDSEHNRYLIIAVNGDYVAAGRGMYEHLNILFNNSEHSLDHGKTWLPCGVME